LDWRPRTKQYKCIPACHMLIGRNSHGSSLSLPSVSRIAARFSHGRRCWECPPRAGFVPRIAVWFLRTQYRDEEEVDCEWLIHFSVGQEEKIVTLEEIVSWYEIPWHRNY
jgi:hypothetical protein